MADEASRPLLDEEGRSSSDLTPGAHQQHRSFVLSSESTPLLRRDDHFTLSSRSESTQSQSHTTFHGTESRQSVAFGTEARSSRSGQRSYRSGERSSGTDGIAFGADGIVSETGEASNSTEERSHGIQEQSFGSQEQSYGSQDRSYGTLEGTYETGETSRGAGERSYETEDRQSISPSIVSHEGGFSNAPVKKSRVRWPTIISLALLTTGVLAILVCAFAAPAVMKEYGQGAAVFKPGTLSIDSTTPDGVRARVQGEFVMDSSRIQSASIRNIGRFMTWIAKEVETGESELEVYLPEYGNVLIGNATIPNIKLNIRNGHHNKIDVLTDLTAGDVKGIHAIAMDWVEGRLDRLRVRGKATLHLKSGLIGLGTQVITDTVTFEGGYILQLSIIRLTNLEVEQDFPPLPDIKVVQLNVHDGENRTMEVDASLNAMLHSPVSLTIPALGFEILVPNCSPGDPYILAANAETGAINIERNEVTNVNFTGVVKRLPDELVTACPGEEASPLDFLVSSYIKGLETTLYIRGADAPSSSEAPDWMVDLLRSVTIPLPFTNTALDNLVKNFTMSDTHFSLPNPFAEPGSPDAQPTVSGVVNVLISLPEEMNLSVEVPRVRALTDVYYLGEQLGNLNIDKWQDANSTIVEDIDGDSALLVKFDIEDAPLQVTDNDLLSKLVQDMLFGSKAIILHVAANVDAKVSTGLGRFAIRGIPADGDVPVNIPSGNSIEHLNPQIVSLEVGETNQSSLSMLTVVNFTNPTEYSATVPFADARVLYNGTAVGHVVARNLSLVPGNNTNASIEVWWNPLGNGGFNGIEAGRALISSFISGDNTSVTIETYKGSIPALPELGKALSSIQFEVPLPKISTPDDDDGDSSDSSHPHFIQDATVHIWSSTADFTLFSPLTSTTIGITSIHAIAFYDENKPVGRINYNETFNVLPGLSQSPHLPVDLVLGGGAYDALRRALGQSLAMDTVAKVGIKVGDYEDHVVYRGKGIEAKVRF
ncbi:hypothetical protein N7478_006924 [Penicillium angulare]|uniref:uncharacterized protein n=1 Tax=Penicillium angulare TaxID=116970 RepID=UPI002541AC3F|nr:uncharacterized protein N7478_006924 [Penicillium angulare]KAJ5281552.1 hypothetical protein N7478_006924 [Penicillium angulare]